MATTSFLFAATLLMCPITVAAQHPSQPLDTTNPDRLAEQQLSSREMQLRNLESQADLAKDPKKLEAIKAGIAQDFDRILILHNQLARFLLDNKPLDYDFVSEASAEIRKRAGHLQRTLVLSLPDEEANKDKYPEFAEPRMRDGVAMLCQQIKNFVTNPIIDKPGTVSEPQLRQARHDLQNVIDLSATIKKGADKLRKSSH
jgi:hypothetical protein